MVRLYLDYMKQPLGEENFFLFFYVYTLISIDYLQILISQVIYRDSFECLLRIIKIYYITYF